MLFKYAVVGEVNKNKQAVVTNGLFQERINTTDFTMAPTVYYVLLTGRVIH